MSKIFYVMLLLQKASIFVYRKSNSFLKSTHELKRKLIETIALILCCQMLTNLVLSTIIFTVVK